MKAKNTLKVSVFVGGLSAAFVADHWPSHAKFAQMAFFSLMVLGALVAFLWSQRRERKIWAAMFVAILMHISALLAFQQYFPFRTVLTIVPFALIEAVVLFGVAIKMLGQLGGVIRRF